jgi:hypothetical protein
MKYCEYQSRLLTLSLLNEREKERKREREKERKREREKEIINVRK